MEKRQPLRRPPNDYNFGSLLMLAGTTGFFLVVTWIATIAKHVSIGPAICLWRPLQNAWADGEIVKTEARQVARVILHIRKEAVKREAEEAFAQAAEIASKAARTF